MQGAILLLTLCSFAQDPIKSKLDRAKMEYETTTYELKKQVLTRFEKAEDSAAYAGDTHALDLVTEEKAEFKNGGQWDFRTIDASDLKPKRDAALKAWAAVLEQTSEAYTKKQKTPEASAARKELDALNKVESESEERAVIKASNLLQPGTRWRGKRTLSDGRITILELIIDSRKGDSFQGRTVLNNANKHRITGSISNGKIEWKVVEILEGPGAGQSHSGQMKNERLFTKFVGPGGPGQKIEGVTELKLLR